MSILSNSISNLFGLSSIDIDQTLDNNYSQTICRGYDPEKVKTYIQLISETKRDDEKILLAADLAYNRSMGRHLGANVIVEINPWRTEGYYSPADTAFDWLKMHGREHGVFLYEGKK